MKKNLLSYLTLTLCVISISAQTTFDPKVTIDSNTGDNPYILDSGDLDGDGDMDIVLGTYDYFGDTEGDVIKWYQNDGSAGFTLFETVSSTTAIETMTLIGGLKIMDVDGVNGNDIVASSADQNKVVWYENDGSGNFADAEVLWSGLVGAGQIAIADINNDTNDDICIVVYGDATGAVGNKVIWYPSNGDGTFGTEQLIDDTIVGPGSINFGYFEIESDDDDESNEDLDAVISSTYGGDIKVFYNQFNESGTSMVSWNVDSNTVDTGNTYVYVAAFHDYDDDGQLDILKSNTGFGAPGDLAWYNKLGDGTYFENPITCSITRPAVAKMADLNDDGFTDLVVTNGSTGADDIVWFESTGAGTYLAEATIDTSQNQVFGITGADFDGDLDMDIATVDFQNFDLNIFINNKYTLSTDSFSKESISIFPNPSSNKLNFKGTTSENFEVLVYDILGKKIIETTKNINSTLDISKLQAGVYFLKFKNYNTTYKFIKE